ncbi:IS66 family transposase, partial [Rhodoferax sp. U2-2l]|nr:IS66 family transposase [Rhodoferax sp. U2-2l]
MQQCRETHRLVPTGTIDKLTHENAYFKRLKFAAQSERFSAEQRSLLEETLDEDLQAVSDEIEQISAT